jgi:hypothetical protein
VSGESWSEGRVRGNWGFLALAAAGAVALLVAGRMDPVRAWANLLVHGYYLVALALGCLVLLAIFYLAEAGWFVAFRRVPEAMAAQLPLLSLLLLLVLFGRDYLYHWTDAAAVAADPLLQTKAPYLNEGSFILRMGVFLVLWSLFAVAVRRVSQGNGTHADGLAKRRRLKLLSAVFIPLYAVTFSLASFDWLMSLEPHWFSTIYGALLMVGMALSAFALAVAVLVRLARDGPLADTVTTVHLHDLGKLLFAFVMVWAYLAFSQFIITYSGNLPEEIPWYLRRLRGGWEWVGLAVALLSFGVPFFALLARSTKKNAKLLMNVALLLVAVRLVDLHWTAAPAFHERPTSLHWLDLAAPVAIGGLWLALFVRRLARSPLLPVGDPALKEAFSNE